MNKTKIYYQPVRYVADDNMIEWGDIPEELCSFQAFATRDDCEEWLENNGYDICDYAIVAYKDDDIEEVTIIDGYGDIVETNESEGQKKIYTIQYTTEKFYTINVEAENEDDAMAKAEEAWRNPDNYDWEEYETQICGEIISK